MPRRAGPICENAEILHDSSGAWKASSNPDSQEMKESLMVSVGLLDASLRLGIGENTMACCNKERLRIERIHGELVNLRIQFR